MSGWYSTVHLGTRIWTRSPRAVVELAAEIRRDWGRTPAANDPALDRWADDGVSSAPECP